MSILPFPKKPSEPCKLCGKPLTDEFADLKYEVFNEEGNVAEEVSFGKICFACADVLDALDEEADMAPDDEDDL